MEQEQDVLIVFDRVAPPTGIGTALSYYVGPVFNIRSNLAPRQVESGFVVSGFEGTFADQQLALWFHSSLPGSESSNNTLVLNFTGPCGGANPTPDACRCVIVQRDYSSIVYREQLRHFGSEPFHAGASRVDAPYPVPGGSSSQVYSLAEVQSGSAVGFVSVLAPVGTSVEALALLSSTSARFFGAGRVEVSLPSLMKRVSLFANGSWATHELK